MAKTFIDGGLGTLQPKSIWISDEKVAACISDSGIVSCLYHGRQAVSRNAFFLKGNINEEALRFVFKNNDKEIPHKIRSCSYKINSCTLEADVAGNVFTIKIYARLESICIEILPWENADNITAGIVLDSTKAATNVYGNRKWQIEFNEADNQVRFVADDRTKISEWTSAHGSFLIPIEIQNKIYIKDELSDITFSPGIPELKASFNDDFLIEAITAINIGGFGFNKLSKSGKEFIFVSSLPAKPIKLLIDFSSLEFDKTGTKQENLDKYKEKNIDSNPPHPDLVYPGGKSLGELFSFVPTVFDSVIQRDTGMPRACAGGYYWVWGWDTITAAMELSKWGQISEQRQIISFMLAHRWKNGTIPHRFGRNYEAINVKPGVTDALFFLLVKQYLEDSGEYAWLNEIYDEIKQIWSGIRKDVVDGFIVGLGTYPDNPRAMGRKTTSRTAVDNGAFYFAIISMLGFARRAGDKDTELKCRDLLEEFPKRYITAFFDNEKQMIFDSFSPDGNNLTYPVYSLISMSSRLGMPLLLNKQKEIACFIAKEYFEEYGFRALPLWDSNKDTECIHHSWFLYWDVCILILLRTFGYTDILQKYENNIILMWEKYRTLYEFTDLDQVNLKNSAFPWNGYGCSWPIHGSISVYRGILEGILGLRTDMGCVTVMQGPVKDGAKLSGLMVAGKKWNFEFFGNGSYISEIKVNGRILECSRVIPESTISGGDMNVSIYRSTENSSELTIIDICNGRIKSIVKKGKCLEVSIKSDGYTTLLFHSKKIPAALLRNEPIRVYTAENQNELYYTRIYEDGIITVC